MVISCTKSLHKYLDTLTHFHVFWRIQSIYKKILILMFQKINDEFVWNNFTRILFVGGTCNEITVTKSAKTQSFWIWSQSCQPTTKYPNPSFKHNSRASFTNSNPIPTRYGFTYTREKKFKHPISKVLQWLPWYAEFWAGQVWSFKLVSWGPLCYTPWL